MAFKPAVNQLFAVGYFLVLNLFEYFWARFQKGNIITLHYVSGIIVLKNMQNHLKKFIQTLFIYNGIVVVISFGCFTKCLSAPDDFEAFYQLVFVPGIAIVTSGILLGTKFGYKLHKCGIASIIVWLSLSVTIWLMILYEFKTHLL